MDKQQNNSNKYNFKMINELWLYSIISQISECTVEIFNFPGATWIYEVSTAPAFGAGLFFRTSGFRSTLTAWILYIFLAPLYNRREKNL